MIETSTLGSSIDHAKAIFSKVTTEKVPRPVAALPLPNSQSTRPQVRKSARAIAAEVADKMHMYETNPAEMDALALRIEEYKMNDQFLRANNDLVKKNISEVPKTTAVVKVQVLDTARAQKEKHRTDVYQAKQVADFASSEATRKEIEQKEQRVCALQARRIKEAEEADEFAFYRKWFTLVILGSRIAAIQNTLFQDQQDEFKKIQWFTSARLIQSTWRKFNEARKERLRHNALIVLTRVIQRYLPRLRLRMKHRAANIIIDTLNDVHNTSRLLKVIKQYRFRVITCQNIAKRFVGIRRAQMQLFEMQWDALVPVWWQKRTTNIQANTSGSDTKKSAAKAKNAKLAQIKRRASVTVFEVPRDIKMKLLESLFLQKRKEYRDANEDSFARLAEWNVEFRKRKEAIAKLMGSSEQTTSIAAIIRTIDSSLAQGLQVNQNTGMPYVKHFNTLLDKDTMIALIERGFIMATN